MQRLDLALQMAPPGVEGAQPVRGVHICHCRQRRGACPQAISPPSRYIFRNIDELSTDGVEELKKPPNSLSGTQGSPSRRNRSPEPPRSLASSSTRSRVIAIRRSTGTIGRPARQHERTVRNAVGAELAGRAPFHQRNAER